jgi:CheY-like chemotaxis protein
MKKLLVVDDVHDVADTTATFFSLLGYDTRTAYNGSEAVDAANEERPDIVFLDLNMPVLDGFGAAHEIRSRYPSPPPTLVAVSALAHLSSDEKLRACGFDYCVTKPADIDELVAIIQRAGT